MTKVTGCHLWGKVTKTVTSALLAVLLSFLEASCHDMSCHVETNQGRPPANNHWVTGVLSATAWEDMDPITASERAWKQILLQHGFEKTSVLTSDCSLWGALSSHSAQSHWFLTHRKHEMVNTCFSVSLNFGANLFCSCYGWCIVSIWEIQKFN